MRSVLGSVMATQLARHIVPDMCDRRTTVRVGSVLDAERAAIMREYVDRGGAAAMHARLEAWASEKRAQGRGAARGGMLG